MVSSLAGLATRWGFDQTLAPEFFQESAHRLLLLDTGLDPNSCQTLNVCRVCWFAVECVPIGLDFLRLFLSKRILTWRLENEQNTCLAAVAATRKQAAEYAMGMDLLNSLARTLTETEAIQQIIEVFTMLFAAQQIFYVPVKDGKPAEAPPVLAAAPVDAATVWQRLRVDQDYAGLNRERFSPADSPPE